MKRKLLDDETIAKIRRLKATGMLIKDIAKECDVNKSTVIYHTSEKRKKAEREARNQRQKELFLSKKSMECVKFDFVPEETRQMAERLMRQVPRDTRDLTGRVFGDPIPGRSALDQRQNA